MVDTATPILNIPTPAALRDELEDMVLRDLLGPAGGEEMETAQTYPTLKELIGVDVSSKVIAHARDQALAKALDGRVQFQTMDALQKLALPTAHFDLVNQRAGLSWLRTWDWEKSCVSINGWRDRMGLFVLEGVS